MSSGGQECAPGSAEEHTLPQQVLDAVPTALLLIVGDQLLQAAARGPHAAVGDVLAELGIRRLDDQDSNGAHRDEDDQGKGQGQLHPQADSRAISRGQPVADAEYRFDQVRCLTGLVQLAAQVLDVAVHRPLQSLRSCSPGPSRSSPGG